MWTVNTQSADASGGVAIAAAVAGKSHYLRRIVINCVVAITATISDGTITLGPFAFAATSGSPHILEWPEDDGLMMTNGAAVTLTTSASGAICVVTQGKTR